VERGKKPRTLKSARKARKESLYYGTRSRSARETLKVIPTTPRGEPKWGHEKRTADGDLEVTPRG